MTMAALPAPRAPLSALALRFALRDLRGGLRGFRVFIACIALGVMAIAGVGSVAGSLNRGLDHQGRTLLGGDASFALMQREATPEERSFLDRRGRVSAAAIMRAMAHAPSGELALVDLKAVDGNYPLLGDVVRSREADYRRTCWHRATARRRRRRRHPAGAARPKLVPHPPSPSSTPPSNRSEVEAEPDKLASASASGAFLVSEDDAARHGAAAAGTLVRWIYRLRCGGGGGEGATRALVEEARTALPQAGWEARTRDNASPQLERSITRFTQYLTLVGLAALLVGGVGVANAIKSHLDERRDVIATFKALGATGREVFTIYLAQVLLLAAIGSLIGLAAGAALPFLIVGVFGSILPLPVEATLHPAELALAFLYGLLTALAFGLWPLGRVHDVPVAALFREDVAAEFHWPRYLALMAAVSRS